MDELQGNRFIAEQLAFNAAELRAEAEREVEKLNVEQLDVFHQVMQSCEGNDGGPKIFFVDGPGGTGKTFVENLLLKSIRGQGHIALAVASSGIAALLLRQGRTAHSRLKIPIELTPTSVCAINKQGDLVEMIRRTKLILWDEAPVMSKFAFEAADRTLRDLTNQNVLFGGITFVMCGNFRQVLPVVPRGMRPDIVGASIKESYLWSQVRVCRLHQNMRVVVREPSADLGNRTFAEWLLALGEDKLPVVKEPDHVRCPLPMIVLEHTLSGLINAIYGGINNVGPNAREYFSSRAILAARNDTVALINAATLDKVEGQVHEFLSADKVDDERGADTIPIEYLNNLEVSGWPPHKLSLKVGTPVMLLRNLDPSNGLCNGTRLTVRRCSARIIEAEILTGEHVGNVAFIPRIPLITEKLLPFPVRRKQFPIRVAYAMTINKSQGQTLPKVGICLTKNVFSHGQLYVVFLRARSLENVVVLLEVESSQRSEDQIMRNVVYSEALL